MSGGEIWKRRQVVDHDDGSVLRTIPSASVVEAATYVGVTPKTWRRWVSQDLLPEPSYEETTYHHYVYHRAEVEIIAEEIAHIKDSGGTYTATNKEVQQAIFRRVVQHRLTHGRE